MNIEARYQECKTEVARSLNRERTTNKKQQKSCTHGYSNS